MSKTVDERVVSMQFDNKHFESNVQTSLSTLDKLKNALKLGDAAKGLDSINKSAKNFDMSPIARSVETVKAKFSALDVMAVTALANITNSAINAGEKIMSALTIDPIKTGFEEYETQINAVQTILSNTRSDGTTLDQVNSALDELNTYADKTIYNFTEMTRNIGTFTAAGVKLDTSVSAIKGIANLAAVSGSNSQQASTAMYQLSQALAAGTVKLQDWNSVVNAGMGGKVFQESLKETARVHGIAIDQMISDEGSFRETLQKGWLSSEILTETLSKFTGDLTEQQILSMGYTKEQAKEILALGTDANDAATKVKTFTQLLDTLKEAAQSGWTQTWEIITGDFEEAKSLWTGVSQFFEGIIGKISNTRNNILEQVMGNPLVQLGEKISNFTSTATDAIDKVQDLGDIVDTVISGKLGDGETRFQKLAEAGYDWAKVQNAVNEKLGSSVRYMEQDSDGTKKLLKAKEKHMEVLENLSDKQLRDVGLTDNEIEIYRDLEKQSKKTGKSMTELIEATANRKGGRELLIESFANIKDALVNVLSTAKKAWQAIFPPKTLYERAEGIYGIILAFNKFTECLKNITEGGDSFQRTMAGIFAALDIVRIIVGGPIAIAFKVLKAVLSSFNMSILDLTAIMGDAIVKLRDFVKVDEMIAKATNTIVPILIECSKVISDFIDRLMAMSKVKKAVSGIKDIGYYIIEGLKNGLKNGITDLPKLMTDLGNKIIDAIKKVLKIHSPSRVMIEIGQYIVEGLVVGIRNGTTKLIEIVRSLGTTIKDILSKADFGTLLAVGISGGTIAAIFKMADAIRSFAAPIEALQDAITNLSKAKAVEMKTKAMRNVALSLLIMVGAVALLTLVDVDKLWNAVGVITVLSGLLIGLSFAMSKLSDAGASVDSNGVHIKSIGANLMTISMSMLILAAAVKVLSSIDQTQFEQGLGGITALMVEMGVFLAAYKYLIRGNSAFHMDEAGGMFIKLAASMLLMAITLKIIGKLKESEIEKGTTFMLLFGGFITALCLISNLAGRNVDKIGITMTKLSVAMLLMIVVVKIAAKLSPEEMTKGILFATGFAVFVAILVTLTRDAGPEMPKVSAMLLSMSVSMLLLIGVMKLISGMSVEEIAKGAVGITILTGVMWAMVMMVKRVGNSAPKMALTLLAMSVSVGILAGVAVILGTIKLKNLAKGVAAVGFLSFFMTAMIVATRGASECKGNLIAMTAAIAVMTACIVALSFIKPKQLLGASAALGILMGMFATIIYAAGLAQSAIVPLIAMTLVVGALAGIIYLMSSLDVKSALAASASIAVLLLSMSVALGVAAFPSSVAPIALISLVGVTAIVAILAYILVQLQGLNCTQAILSVEALTSLLLGLSESLILLEIAGIAGPAALIGVRSLLALIVGLGTLMAAIGALVEWQPKIEDFINNSIPVLESIGYALGSFMGNIVGGLLGGITSGLPEVAKNITDFMIEMQSAMAVAGTINSGAVDNVNKMVEMIEALSKAELYQKLESLIPGKSLDTFTDDIKSIGYALVEFSDTVSGKIDGEAVEAAASAGKMLAEMADMVPSSGPSVFEFFTGIKDLTDFGFQIKQFGTAIVTFSEIVSGKIDGEAVEAAASAGKLLAEMADMVPSSGPSVVGFFTGDTDLTDFGFQIKQFANALVTFSETVSGKINETAIESAASAGKMLAEMAKMIPSSGKSVFSFFAGEKKLDKFGNQLEDFGKGLVKFSKAVSGNINDTDIKSAASSGKTLAEMSDILPKNGFKKLKDAKEPLENFGAGLASFNNKVSGINTEQLNERISGFSDVIDKLKRISSSGLTAFVNNFKNAEKTFGSAGKRIMSSFAKGLKDNDTEAKTSFADIIEKMATSVSAKYLSFKTSGEYVVKGFAEGIRSSTYIAEAKAKEMAAAAATAAKKELDEHSPSKVFYKIGAFAGEGFTNALGDYEKKASKAGSSMAKTAVNGLGNAITKVKDLISEGIDDNPTIRPVLDLSNVTSGARELNDLLSVNASIETLASVGSISSMMNRRTQNGTTDDVVSAIKDLGRKVTSLERNTYTINGITYDDGSSVSSAVESLVRAARIERRI